MTRRRGRDKRLIPPASLDGRIEDLDLDELRRRLAVVERHVVEHLDKPFTALDVEQRAAFLLARTIIEELDLDDDTRAVAVRRAFAYAVVYAARSEDAVPEPTNDSSAVT